MTIYGIGAGQVIPGDTRSLTRAEPHEEASGQTRTSEPVIAGLAAAPGVGRREPATAIEAPKGTDPALWSVLTNEERRFFARAVEGGPLLYGRDTAPTPLSGVRVGGRIDVRV